MMHNSLCIGVVTDPAHARFGEVGDIKLHDMDSDTVHLQFPDEKREVFTAAWFEGDLCVPAVRIVERKETRQKLNLQRALPGMKEALATLKATVANGGLPYEERETARLAFWKALEDGKKDPPSAAA